MNDVLTNAVAVVCVVLAVKLGANKSHDDDDDDRGDGSMWWAADAVGAAVISVWIMASWFDTGKVRDGNSCKHGCKQGASIGFV